ncbi:ParB N-terminal domain-containing protein [Streptomyces sp. NPDC026665]|uniref:ParB N-terminal domain-containing protein n=1 Tax=Streptomyces sp. NPDC026665 TaxID=3154798 RepID=UPI0033FC5653
MAQKPGLKRDLSAERAARKAATQQARLVPQGLPTVRPDQLMPSPENGRKKLLKIDELAATLTTDGMNTAMTVIPPDVYGEIYPQHKEAVEAQVAEGILFVVHHGHRRLAAALKAGLTEVPILVRRDVPSLRIAAIQENLQRMGLNPVEEAIEFQEALDERDEAGKQLSQRELARRVGCSQTYVSHRVALLRLVPVLQQAVIDHWLKEQNLLGASDQDADLADAPLMLPVREAATVYARLRADMQDAFAAGELTSAQAAVLSKVPADEQAFPSQETTGDHATISNADAATSQVPEPRMSESARSETPVVAPESSSTASEPRRGAQAPRESAPDPRPAVLSEAVQSRAASSAEPESSDAQVSVAEEPRGVIVVRSVEELALSIIDLLKKSEIEELKAMLSS